MASRGQQTGMRGVYLAAAELVARGFTVSVTSRNAMGADLLVTDDRCERTWSVQVKTNAKPASFWLVGERARAARSRSHVYVLVNLRGEGQPDFYIVPSRVVAAKMRVERRANSTWYALHRRDCERYRVGWNLFESIPR